LHFDAAHLSLLIAGEAFQQPLHEGAHVMTTSTYKALGGPPGGLVLTDDAELAARLDAAVYPGLTANNDLGRVAALCVALNDLRVHGRSYARRCAETARVFAGALAQAGFAVAGRPAEYTATHHVALDARSWGGGTHTARRLEPANILTTGIGLPLPAPPGDFAGLRLGTQELVRWGMGDADMPGVAELLARVLLHGAQAGDLREEVVALRERYQAIQYVVAPE
jgi:glycine hydroxymethyltransferase